jgi:hypothetical protein
VDKDILSLKQEDQMRTSYMCRRQKENNEKNDPKA